MHPYVAEFVGTAILILLGNGVVANVVLSETKGHAAGWIVITAGWGFAVFTAVLCVADFSGAHLNPAVTIGLAVGAGFEWNLVAGYIVAQMAGAIVGAGIVYVFYMPHYAVTDDPNGKLATFCTAPAIRKPLHCLFSEVVGTFILVYAALRMSSPVFEFGDVAEVKIGLGSVGAIPIGLIVFAIGLSLGGTTGYAINPARDLGPRIAHFLLPVPGKRDSYWPYAVIPVAGPIGGALLAALHFLSHA